MNPHPAADLFPMLDEDALWSLVNDIKLHGLRQPIIIHKGQIIDGRNRHRACDLAGVKPRFKDMEFADERAVIDYIISTNIHRRHLTESQRAMIAAELANLPAHRPGEVTASIEAVSQPQAAEMLQVSRSSVQRAREVQEKAPDLAAKVKSGELKVSKAASMARERVKAPIVTDPNQADDSVIDATEQRHAEGDTPKARSVLAAISKLDPTELSFIKPDLLKILGVS